jgi:ubiquinone/menaquinone biosynthesis C-methylase UbiE
VLEQCRDCGVVFQNPRLSLDGLDFYYRDFYDRLGGRSLEFVFGQNDEGYEQRALSIAPYHEPRRWLDVGTGHGHFCLSAREVWPGATFDGLDLSDSIDEAAERAWVDRGYRGLFPELAGVLAEQYDVVSMHHYLEHTREPVDEIAAAYKVLEAGGYLEIEVPDPESRWGSILRKYWVPWFQPQHQHLIPLATLERLLREHGFEPLHEDRGEAHQAVDLLFATYLVVERLAPTSDLPWRAPTTALGHVRRGTVFTLALPVFVAAVVADQLLKPLIRRGRRSNTYRVVARKT